MNSHSRDIRWRNDRKVMIINVKCVGEKTPQTMEEMYKLYNLIINT